MLIWKMNFFHQIMIITIYISVLSIRRQWKRRGEETFSGTSARILPSTDDLKHLSYWSDPPPLHSNNLVLWKYSVHPCAKIVVWLSPNIPFYKPETKSFHFRYIGPFGLNMPFLYDANEAITCFIMFCNKKSCLFAT